MTTATQTATSTWTSDSAHSIAEFAVKHLVVATVKGRFREFDATLELDEAEPENSSVTASIQVASVDTNVAARDADLRSDNFFSAEQYPLITFRSTAIERVNDRRYKVHGDLTIRDATRPVTLDTEFEGEITDPYGNRRAGFTAITEISRSDFGIKWNQVLEAGGVAVGDNVRITLHIEAVQQTK